MLLTKATPNYEVSNLNFTNKPFLEDILGLRSFIYWSAFLPFYPFEYSIFLPCYSHRCWFAETVLQLRKNCFTTEDNTGFCENPLYDQLVYDWEIVKKIHLTAHFWRVTFLNSTTVTHRIKCQWGKIVLLKIIIVGSLKNPSFYTEFLRHSINTYCAVGNIVWVKTEKWFFFFWVHKNALPKTVFDLTSTLWK